MERFVYKLQKSRQNALNSAAIRTVFLKGVIEDYIDVLNIIEAGDISQKPFDQIIELCRKYSRSKSKVGKGIRAIKLVRGSVTQIELGNLLENFKHTS